MKWQYTLIDRNNNSHIIDEPVGWDACEIEIKRDLEKHGVVFDYQGNDFLFYNLAFRLIKDEYDTYGAEGIMLIKIEESCGDGFVELYTGKLLFVHCIKSEGSECYIKIPVETTSDIIEFTNRFDQKVDLQTTLAFDEVTALPTYNKLPFVLDLPSKGILLKNNAINAAINSTPCDYPDSPFNTCIEIGFDTMKSNEIGNFFFNPQPTLTSSSALNSSSPGFYINSSNTIGFDTDILSPVINFDKQYQNVKEMANRNINISYRIAGRLTAVNEGIRQSSLFFLKRSANNIFTELNFQNIHAYDPNLNNYIHKGDHVDFDLIYNSIIKLQDGDRLYLCMPTYAYVGYPSPYIVEAFTIEFNTNCVFNMYGLSITDTTPSKFFAVNEAISRVTEAITNNKIKAYSEYFGRTDSQPYSHSQDGFGSLEAITKGLFIRRQENRIAGQPFAMNVSLQDLWQGLEPIHHIGMGIEQDANRPGCNRLRIEPWKYFYKNDVIMNCIGVDKIETKVVANEIYSTAKLGYEKWEAEEYTGLDEFLTKRSFRTTLTQIKNELSKLSKFIASGYALEITRRKGDDNSKDWRYDNDVFIVCLTRQRVIAEGIVNLYFDSAAAASYAINWCEDFTNKEKPIVGDKIIVTNAVNNTQEFTIAFIAYDGTANTNGCYEVRLILAEPVTYESITNGHYIITRKKLTVELGNIDNPQNIIDPATIYNYRISPIRVAMRWIDKLLAGYKSGVPNKKIIFMDGDGNYYAKGKMHSTSYRLENTDLAENNSIDISVFANSNNANPLLATERVEYEYPMSTAEFKAVKNNPYGLIYYNNETQSGYGWIDTIKYKPEEGLADFSLIPKY